MSLPDAKQRLTAGGRFFNAPRSAAHEPWYARAAPLKPGHVAIIGGGIAGTAIAAALERRGWTGTLIERHTALAAEASGTPSGVVMPRLTADDAIDGRIHAAAWRYAVPRWSGCAFYDPCGVLQLATDAAEASRQALVAARGAFSPEQVQRLDAGAASAVAGCALPFGGLYFPGGGVIDTKGLCESSAAGISKIFGREVAALERDGERWRLRDHRGDICTADAVVFANAGGARAFSHGAWLPLAARRGQISRAAPTAASKDLRCVLAYGGTITPPRDGLHAIGATFDWLKADAPGRAVNAGDDLRNLGKLADVLPDMAAGLESAGGSWAAVRWTSPDHLPMVGPLPQREAFERDYAPLRHGQHWVDYPPATYEPGLYSMAGFGSHGLILAPLAAELLACHITGEPLPLEQDLTAALHPGRFLIRAIKRQK